MKKVAIIIADGSEELEVITPLDILRRAEGVKCDLISVGIGTVTCSHALSINADKTIGEVDLNCYDAIVIPGGMPGATNIAKEERVIFALKSMQKAGKIIASICASPAVVLTKSGILEGKKATCYPAPDFISLMGESYTGADVLVSDNLITANGPKSAFKFALEICKALKVQPKV